MYSTSFAGVFNQLELFGFWRMCSAMWRSSGNMITVPATNPAARNASFVVKNGACVSAWVVSRGLADGGTCASSELPNAAIMATAISVSRRVIACSCLVEATRLVVQESGARTCRQADTTFLSTLSRQNGLGRRRPRQSAPSCPSPLSSERQRYQQAIDACGLHLAPSFLTSFGVGRLRFL